jgi:8-oxo-dGTP pyrophosphatase MutT (NUDIX family)
MKEKKYFAAGGIVLNNNKILILVRPKHNEIRLPKGHIDEGESAEEAALREVLEESGYSGLKIIACLGTQVVSFTMNKTKVIRTEYYYLMELSENYKQGKPEDQFKPEWIDIDEAIGSLTFEPEKEWVRRAKIYISNLNKKGE